MSAVASRVLSASGNDLKFCWRSVMIKNLKIYSDNMI